MPSTTGEFAREEKETGRLEAFSDGVFGIAMTLLVLDIKVPRAAEIAGHSTLAVALIHQWPAFAAYVLSFVTVLVMWTNHHKIFQLVRRTDHSFLLINGLLLMFVTLVPFPTGLLAEHLSEVGGTTAAAVYCGTFVAISVLFNLLWHYAADHGRLLVRGYDAEAVRAITKQYRFGPLLYVVALLLAFINVKACMGLCAGLVVFFAIPEKK
jgi:uncharacterized membrane protein